MDWSSKQFYHSKLIADPSVAEHTLKDRGLETELIQDCILVIDTAGCEMYESRDQGSFLNESKFNIGEADLVKLIVVHLLELDGINPGDIGVIAPYNAQVSFLKELIHNKKVQISTVDGFQGREKEIIILSMVRSNLDKKVGFLANERRLNVAVTRARRFLCLIGDCSTLQSNQTLASLIKHCSDKGEVKSALEFRDNPEVRFGEGNAAIGEEKKEFKEHKNNDQQLSRAQKKKNKQKRKQSSKIDEQQDKEEKKSKKREEKHQKKNQKMEKQEQQLLDLFDQIREFMQNEAEAELSLPPYINAYQRMKIHQFCESKQIIHESRGIGPNRALYLRKKEKKIDQCSDKQNEQQDKEEEEVEQQHTVQKKEQASGVGQKKKKKKRQKNKQQQQSKNVLTPQEQDEAALLMLQQLVQESKQCFIKGCQKSVQMMGRICPYCNKKFCFSHIIPEIHGCGKQAAKSAYQAQKKAYEDSQHSKISLAKRRETKEVIAKKIQEMQEARTKKIPEKKKK